MRYYQTFTVSGKISFPLDMLRYDHCFPRSPRDSSSICADPCGNELTIDLGRYVGTKSEEPTLGRWASFGWHVDKHSIVTRR